MADKTWKRIERAIATAIGGERVPVTGRQRGSAPDISHEILAVEVKHRKKLPSFFGDMMLSAENLDYQIVEYLTVEGVLVLLRLKTLNELMNDESPKTLYLRQSVRTGGLIGEVYGSHTVLLSAFDQAEASAKQLKQAHNDIRCPVVFLHEQRMKVEDTFVVFTNESFSNFLTHLHVKSIKSQKVESTSGSSKGRAV